MGDSSLAARVLPVTAGEVADTPSQVACAELTLMGPVPRGRVSSCLELWTVWNAGGARGPLQARARCRLPESFLL